MFWRVLILGAMLAVTSSRAQQQHRNVAEAAADLDRVTISLQVSFGVIPFYSTSHWSCDVLFSHFVVDASYIYSFVYLQYI